MVYLSTHQCLKLTEDTHRVPVGMLTDIQTEKIWNVRDSIFKKFEFRTSFKFYVSSMFTSETTCVLPLERPAS